ncbi:hypothetical protein BACCAP_01506 [Pseudoflavonifractor capillosus ATCC 29799]|uniref:DUF4867 domain-containing protein n=1 Tax=Pseudoflavonifractor capillosus ATCC 29799 TaxID=411467 RepID=A6NTH7_9FIRM|nr:DUF4867 family protein [Pseudoflavonifractor capillosus]EDN00740.1 hypothetical protein BACCAP_01506 [Pseudoflavonifractor capillosus ATCC 29799]
MEIKNIFDREFASYGQIHQGYHLEGLLSAMESIPLPEQGTDYRPSMPELETADCFRELEDRAFGGMPIQVGMCWGHNTRLNCLEYHRSSEFNLGTVPFVLLLAHQWEVVDGVLDTDKVAAFYVPAGTLVEVYATSLHYAPCHVDATEGFRVAVVLPRGTNTEKPELTDLPGESRRLWARNKWLLAHPDTTEAQEGAQVGLRGENTDIAEKV